MSFLPNLPHVKGACAYCSQDGLKNPSSVVGRFGLLILDLVWLILRPVLEFHNTSEQFDITPYCPLKIVARKKMIFAQVLI